MSFTAQELKAQRLDLIDYVQTKLVAEVSAVAVDPNLPQASLSERLANAGILPMFGFPTHVRLLFHKRPRGGGAWPPDGVIDRDLDIAISQFAPCSESVKDGLIHTAAGVVDYQPHGNTVSEEPNPLGPAIVIGQCRRCQAIDSSDNPEALCTVCGAGEPDYRIVRLSQPRGFRTWPRTSRDFDGVFEWTARASRPRLGLMLQQAAVAANFELFWGSGKVFTINDNNGQLFNFEKTNQGETWVTREALSKSGIQFQSVLTGLSDPRALASIKHTDVLVLAIRQWPSGVTANPQGVAGKAALFSAGFLLRRAAAVMLDIHERELKVGLKVVKSSAGNVDGQIFISDSLENGAGYSSYFSTPLAAETLIRFVVGNSDGKFNARLVATVDNHGNEAHAALCRTSCPDCLRDFSNLAYHNILDWRLGLDIARLALDPAAPVDFSVGYWKGLDGAAAGPYFAALPGGWQHVTFAGLQAGRRGNEAEIITHPLWNTEQGHLCDQLAAAETAARAAGCTVTFKSLFEVLRRPF